jgi:hypothetical protein
MKCNNKSWFLRIWWFILPVKVLIDIELLRLWPKPFDRLCDETDLPKQQGGARTDRPIFALK